MKTVLATGGQGFIGSAVCQEFLNHNYRVISLDNYSKYGFIQRPHDNHPNFKLIQQDAKLLSTYKSAKFLYDFAELNCENINYIVHCAASIGGIKFFHEKSYDLLAENMRLDSAVFDYAINEYKKHYLKRIIALASSMIMDMTNIHPTSEKYIPEIPPPPSSYGFSKLGTM